MYVPKQELGDEREKARATQRVAPTGFIDHYAKSA